MMFVVIGDNYTLMILIDDAYFGENNEV